ncbi:hypothetical protein MPSEU_000221400 [Mayamaea pseudoterrestris]|nr:hypothetical protein MPSEU_000221400 [Mayamaea pseudoterrestris]
MAAATKQAAKAPIAAGKTQAKAVKKEKSSKNKADKTTSISDSVVKQSIQTSKTKIDSAQLKRALDALLQHETKKQEETSGKQLIESDVPVQIQIGLLKAPGYASPKPHRILLPHSIRTSNDDLPEVCLIVKDASKEWLQELLPHFPEHLGCITKILTLTSLRTKHQTFAQKRALASKYSHFLADDRILPMLPSTLGKEFYRQHKIVPVSLTRKEALPFTIQRAMSSTHLKMAKGTCLTVAVGTIKHSSDELLDNCLAAVAQCVEHVPRQWKNVLSLCLKTPRSMALPFYNQLPEQLLDVSTLRSQAEIDEEMKLKKAEEAKLKKEQAVVKKEKRALSDEKSPLLRALKKQKAAEEELKAKTLSKSEEKAQKDDAKNSAGKEKAPKDEEKAPKDEKKAVVPPAGEKEKTTSKKESAAKSETPSTKKRDEPDQADKSSAKRAKKTPEKAVTTVEKKTKDAPAAPAAMNDKYIASKSFTGSKKGYVFKKGPQGLGYYKDQPPVVDTLAMEALLRMAKEKGRAGAGKKKHSGGGGGFKGKKSSRGRR